MPYTFLDLAIDVIKSQNTPLSAFDIWNKAKELGYDTKFPKHGKTPEKTIGAQIYVDIKENGGNSRFIQVSKRPALFFFERINCSFNTYPRTRRRGKVFL